LADNKKYYYLKLKENFFESDEAIILESMPDGYLYSNILLKLYLRSLKNDGLLMFNNLIPYNTQMLATITRHQIGTIEKAIQIFQQLKLIEFLDNGAIYMSNIQNFVGKSSTEGDRKRAERAQNKLIGQMSGQMSDKRPPEIEKEIEHKSKSKNQNKNNATADFSEIYSYYQQEIGVLSPNQAEQLADYIKLDNFEPELLKRAIDKASGNAKRSFGYVNSILRNWRQNGITTLVQAEEEDRKFHESKQQPAKSDIESTIPDDLPF
jgi:DnaD_dom: DnaD and phage-associated domain